MSLKRPLIAAGFAALGAFSMVTFSAVASPDDLAGSSLAAEQQARPEARAGKRGKMRSPGAKMMMAVEQLDLSPEQRSQLEALKSQHRPERKSAGRSGTKSRAGGDLLSGEVDRDTAHAKLDARYQDRLARAHIQLDRTLDVIEILTPEQRAELKVAMKPEAGAR